MRETQEGARWKEWLVGKAAWARSRTFRSSATANGSSSSSSSSHTNSVPCTHTLTPERERERSPQLQSKFPRDKKEKRTKMGRDVIMIKRERGARIFRDGEHASVQGKNGRASEPVSKRGREKERV